MKKRSIWSKKYFHSVIWDSTVCLAASSSLPTPSLYLKTEGRFLLRKSFKKKPGQLFETILILGVYLTVMGQGSSWSGGWCISLKFVKRIS